MKSGRGFRTGSRRPCRRAWRRRGWWFGTYPIRGKTLRSGPPASRPTIQDRVIAGSVIYADEASCWDTLHARYLTKRINHSEAYSMDAARTNQAESFFSRLRRAEIGMHHHIAGPYLKSYADEMAWREDNRRRSNGELN